MAAKLFSLRNVPDEEADGVRDLLRQHNIAFYETPPNAWGISAPIIWVEDPAQLARAKNLLERFQVEYTARASAAHAAQRVNQQQPTLLGTLLQHPLRTLGLLAFAGIIAYVSIVPFIELGQ